jgi:hypothetical protein
LFKRSRVNALLGMLDAVLAFQTRQIYHTPDEVGANAPSVLPAQRAV